MKTGAMTGRKEAAAGSARDAAYQQIRQKIIDFTYKPGESISDKVLAEEMAMSRTPVREALILLAAYNMIVLRPQIGTFVAPIDLERMEMEQFSRFALEKEVISRAIPLAGEETRWLYEENLRAYRHYAESASPEREATLLELDNAYHSIAFRTAGKESDYRYMLGNLQHIERMRSLSLTNVRQEETIADHQELSEAILNGDEKTALSCLERHLSRYRDNLQQLQEKYPEYFALGR